jgi:hypothetical protein
MEPPLRVHICVVGFELDRINLAATEMKADKVYLISQEKEGNQGKKFVDENKRILEERDIIVQEEHVPDIRNFSGLLSKIKHIIISEDEKHFIYINTSSGSTLAAIAGTISSMMFSEKRNIIPYYVKPKKYSSGNEARNRLNPISEGVAEITELLTFPMKLPKKELIIALEYIEKNEKSDVTKKDLINYSYKNETLKAFRESKKTLAGRLNEKTKNNNTSSKEESVKQTAKDYAWLNQNIISKLKDEWGLIYTEKVGQFSCIRLTSKGKNMVEYLIR